MLVLMKGIDNRLIIGDEIAITVLDINDTGSQVKIGIDAPEHINIVRSELLNHDSPDSD